MLVDREQARMRARVCKTVDLGASYSWMCMYLGRKIWSQRIVHDANVPCSSFCIRIVTGGSPIK